MLRVVLDTNIRYSSIGFAGLPRDVVRYCRSTTCLQVISPALLLELRSTLLRRYSVPAVQAALIELESSTLLVHPEEAIEVCRDPDDDRVLECAIAGQADIIVTGDKDLLALYSFRGIRILTPRQFYDEFITSSHS